MLLVGYDFLCVIDGVDAGLQEVYLIYRKTYRIYQNWTMIYNNSGRGYRERLLVSIN